METIAQLNKILNNFVWGPIMLFLLVGVGIYYTAATGLFQITKISLWMKGTIGSLLQKKDAGSGAVTPFQAMTTALAATVGTGNMVGVSTAIVSGGPGAVFWMWVSAFFGMMTKYAEIVLSLSYRKRNVKGEWVGGPMYYLAEAKLFGFSLKWLAVLFAGFGALAAFGIGNMAQVNSISTGLETMFVELGWLQSAAGNGGFSFFKLTVGILVAALVALVIIGGLKRIGIVTEKLVPMMSLFYIIGAISVLIINRVHVLPSLQSIFAGAFNIKAATGGVFGYTIAQAMRFGIARGVFSNEAGLGSAPIAHAAAEAKGPVEQAFWGIFEVFIDTLIICTLTALVLLSSGAYTGPDSISGALLTMAAYKTALGTFGTIFVAVSITLFAFSTILSWSLYGQRCFEYLFGTKRLHFYQIVFVLCAIVASVMELELAWDIADTLNGLMAIPNLIGLVALSGTVLMLTRKYIK